MFATIGSTMTLTALLVGCQRTPPVKEVDRQLSPPAQELATPRTTDTTVNLPKQPSSDTAPQYDRSADSSSIADPESLEVVVPEAAASLVIAHPNEPPGFVPISRRGFDAKVEEGWKDRGDRRFGIAEDLSAPISPPSVGAALFPAGYAGGRGPINTALDVTGYGSIYLSMWIKLSPNWQGAGHNGINKVLHIWIGGGSRVVFALMGRGRQRLLPQLRMQNMRADRRGISFNLNPRLGMGMKVQPGQWYNIEILLRANTPGRSNGLAEWWVNGVKVGQYFDLSYLGFGESREWERVSWNPTWGQPKDKVANDMYMYMDHFYVSGGP